MNDFFGQPILPGAWIVCGGQGSCHGEYGMILYRVESVTDTAIKARRISVGKDLKIITRVLTLRSPTRFVVVTPPQQAVDLWMAIHESTATADQYEQAVNWLAGKQVFDDR